VLCLGQLLPYYYYNQPEVDGILNHVEASGCLIIIKYNQPEVVGILIHVEASGCFIIIITNLRLLVC